MTPPRADHRARDQRFQDPHFPEASRPPQTGAQASRGPRAVSAGRTGAKRTLLDTIRQLPHYLRLLGGLLVDRRVSLVDKALLAGAIAYIVSPFDLIPDFVPFLGQVDDVFLLMGALERLVANAGEDVLYDHWRGDPADLASLDFQQVIGAATLFLPGGIKAKLVRLVRGRGRGPRRRLRG